MYILCVHGSHIQPYTHTHHIHACMNRYIHITHTYTVYVHSLLFEVLIPSQGQTHSSNSEYHQVFPHVTIYLNITSNILPRHVYLILT